VIVRHCHLRRSRAAGGPRCRRSRRDPEAGCRPRSDEWKWVIGGESADTRPLTLQRSVANAEPASLCRLGRFPGDDHHLPEADRYAANLAFEPEKSITCVSVPAQSGAPRKVGLQTDLAKPRAVIVASMPSSMMKHPNCDSMCPLRIARGVARCSSRPLLFALAAGMSTWHLRT
jgi:hypothetical protein